MKRPASPIFGTFPILAVLMLLGSSEDLTASGKSIVNQLFQEVGDVFEPCLAHNASGPWTCLKAESLAAVDRLALAPRIPLLYGMSLVRTGSKIGQAAAKEIQPGASWHQSVLEALRRLLQSHILEIDMRGECNGRGGMPVSREVLTVRFDNQVSLTQHPALKAEGRHRRRQQMIPMMIFGVTVFGMFIVPIAFQFLTALSGKAFLMAKLALLLASINGLKRVASTGVHYGLYHAVDQYSAGPPRHPPPPLHVPFGAGPMLYERTDGLGYVEGPRTTDGDASEKKENGTATGGGLAPFFNRWMDSSLV